MKKPSSSPFLLLYIFLYVMNVAALLARAVCIAR